MKFGQRLAFSFLFLLFTVYSTQAQICNKSQLPANIQNGLVAFYPFCGNANDASGNGNNGTVNGATLTTDRFGSALSAYEFNGSTSHITVADNSANDFTTAFTLSCWVNPYTGGGATAQILGKWGAGGVNNAAYVITITNSGEIVGAVHDGINNTLISSTPQLIPMNQWSHIVMMLKSGSLYLYVNSNLVQTVGGGNSTQNTIYNLDFGREGFGNYVYYKGGIDDILLFNRGLICNEVSQLYNASSTTFPELQTFSFNPLSDTTRVCGTTTSLDAGSGYASYSWNTGATTQSITATTSGFYNVTVTNAAGCTASDSTYLSLVNANIINNDTTICKGSSITLSIDSLSLVQSRCDISGVPTALQNGLTAYYPFCGNTNDISNNGNNATNNGAVLSTDREGNPNASYSFNGASSYMSILPSSSLSISQSLSISFWAYPTSTNAGIIVDRDLCNPNPDWSINWGSSKFGLRYGVAGTDYFMESTTPLTLNSWYHVLVVRDFAASKVLMYINGVLNNSINYPSSLFTNTSLPIHFGASVCNRASNPHFNGKLDEVMIWSRALNASEAQLVYNNQSVSWSPGGATTNSITVSPTQTTTYYVTVTDGVTTCTDSVKVTVSDLSSFNPLSDTTRVCGKSTTLDAGPGFASYSWNTGATTQSITATTSGFYKVTVTNAAGCTASDSTFLSLVNANILNNDTTICKGASITLSIDSLFPGRSPSTLLELPQSLRQGLVAFYPFNSNALDKSGFGNHGNIIGAQIVRDRYGLPNSALFFNGTGDKVIVPSTPSFQFQASNSFSLSYWIKPQILSSAANFILIKQTGAGLTQDGWNSNVEAMPNSTLRIQNNGLSSTLGLFGSGPILTGQYYHIVQCFGSGVGTIYINGLQVSQSPAASAVIGDNSASLNIGAPDVITGTGTGFNGTIDDILIYNRTLSATEVYQLYRSSPTVTWSTGATTNSITVSPTQSTTYYVTVTDGVTTCTDSVKVTVSDLSSFNPLSDTTSQCGTSKVLDAGSGYASYSWNTGATTQSITATTGGFYKVTVTNAAGCTASDSTYLSLVNANIINNDTTICKGSSITLSIDSLFPGRTVCNANQLPPNLRNGLVGYWPFCGNANDESGNGNNASIANGGFTLDRYGRSSSAYLLNGLNQYVEVTNPVNLPLGNSARTFSIWAKYSNSLMGGIYNDWNSLICHGNFSQNCGGTYVLANNNQSVIFASASGGPCSALYLPGLSIINSWHHYVMTYNGAESIFYLDGVRVLSEVFANQLGTAVGSLSFGVLRNSLTPSQLYHLNGSIDDIAIYNRALSDSEVWGLYSNLPTVTWSNGATTNSITVSPTQTTTYYVTVTDGITTCTDSVKVTISQVDTSLTLLDPPQLCATGGQVRLQAGTASSYQWLLNGTAISGATAQTYSATQSGTYRVALVNALNCRDTSRAVTITVNPNPTVNAVNNSAVCNGANFAGINFSGSVAGTVYSWTNNNTAIGLAASGTGDLPSFSAVNTGTTPVTATITVTPSYTSGGLNCTGTAISFTITVNPTPTVNAVTNQTLCNGVNTTAISFSGAVTGTVYNWTNNTTSIGLAASGTGNIASFTAVNTGTNPVTATISVTPSYTNGGVTCTGTAQTFTITVNPTPTVTLPTDQTLCNGANTTAVAFSGAVTGTVYNWTNTTTSIGLAASGTGDIASFAAVNTGTIPVTATITVTPSFTNGGVTCTGTPRSFTITVNPTPTVNAVNNQTLCNGANTTSISFSGAVTGTVYSWTNNTTSIGLAASGTGNIASFIATNSTASPVTATITVTPSYTNGGVTCTGTAQTFTITVNPTPTATIANPGTSIICQGSSVTLTASGGSTYQWFLNGNIIPGANAATYPATLPGIYTVIPTSAFSCTGTVSNAITLSLISRPTADFTFDKYCAGFPTNFTNLSQVNGSGVVGYVWSFGDGNTSTLVNPSNVYAQTGSYNATLLVTPLACPALTSTITKPVIISPPPANVRYPSLNAVTNRDLQLQARLFTGAGYQWIPTIGLNNATIQTPIFNYNQAQQYLIRINTAEGCVITDTLLVRMFTQREIYLPTVFSPNGDGANDVLIPRLVGIADLIYFRVYDRWGQLMYQTTQENQGWDGAYKGVKQPMETYAWMAEGKDIDGNIIKRSGTVILLR